jgi:hypothetical protein
MTRKCPVKKRMLHRRVLKTFLQESFLRFWMMDSNSRRSTRARNPLNLLTFSDFQEDREWR